MTREQTIIIGFLVAAFVTGWIARALVGGRDRERPPDSAPAKVADERLDRALEASLQKLDRAVRDYLANLALSVRDSAGDGHAPSEEGQLDPLAEEVSAALQDDTANESMLRAVEGERGGTLTERELDLADWGFAYGVAWGRARERDPSASDEAVAREALAAAEPVFRAYTADAEGAEPAGEPQERGERGNGRAGWPRLRR